MDTLASSCAFLEPPGSLMAPGPGDTERGDWAPSLLPVFLTSHHLTFPEQKVTTDMLQNGRMDIKEHSYLILITRTQH